MLWEIWKERNAYIFKNKKFNWIGFWNKIESLVIDNFNTIIFKQDWESCEDFVVLAYWGANRKKASLESNLRLSYKWKPPH